MQRSVSLSILLLFVLVAPTSAEEQKKIPRNAKVFVEPMDGFETNLLAAFKAKNVPLVVVSDKESADFLINGKAESQKASTAKKIIALSWHSSETAAIQIVNRQTGDIVYAYSYNNTNSAHGKKSSAEACAKHLKDQIK